MPMPVWADGILIAGELLAKRLYWSSAWLRKKIAPLRWHNKPTRQTASRRELTQFLREIGVDKGALVMAHTAVSDLQLSEEPARALPPAVF